MPEIRLATIADAEALADQRVQMFLDAEVPFAVSPEAMRETFLTWVRPRLADGSYTGWLVEENGTLVAGAGLWVMEWPPHFLHLEPQRAYLLNFYVAPQLRRQGLARKLLHLAVEESRARGLRLVTLHASKFGKPVYEQYGFQPSTEMLLRLADSSS